MCGICGVASFDTSSPVDEGVLRRMCQVQHHRGPDGEGYYLDRNVGLGMRRLSIIDLVTGQQPIANEDGTLWLVHNGEIYNYEALRSRLIERGHTFASSSDSEVIVHAFEEFGIEFLQHLNGMFAFAIWDSVKRRLLLARDRLGIKPLYYYAGPNSLVFGSELRALMAHPGVPRTIDPVAVDQFLTLEYIPAPRTILQGVSKLLPGHLLMLDQGKLAIEQYWDVPMREAPPDESSSSEALQELIRDAVRLQLRSDVPVGALLSGGIDSSTVVAVMSQAASRPIRTFSIGFDDRSYDELPYARLVARHFGTDHSEEVLRPEIAGLAEDLVSRLDEPLADFSIFPTYLVSKMASDSAKVVLSGDGGDEIFGGYESYMAQRLDRFYQLLPARVRQESLPMLLGRVAPTGAKKGLVNKAKRFVEGAALPPSLQHTRWMTFLTDDDKAALYQPELSGTLNDETAASVIERYFRKAASAEPLAQQQYVDLKTYLADDILTKLDRMSMAASIEARVPLLDHRIVEFALSLPPRLKLRLDQSKVILRRAMAGHLPPAVLNRPKQGFSIPLKHWLREPLRPLMMDLLSPESLRHRGYFQPRCVDQWISEHSSARANHSHRLWTLMVLELWQRQVLRA